MQGLGLHPTCLRGNIFIYNFIDCHWLFIKIVQSCYRQTGQNCHQPNSNNNMASIMCLSNKVVNNKYSINWPNLSLIILCKVITALYSHMARQGVVRLSQWVVVIHGNNVGLFHECSVTCFNSLKNLNIKFDTLWQCRI